MRILVIKLSSLGDLFHALPAVHSLKAGLKADVDWVTQAEYAEVVRCFTDVDRVIPFPRKAFFSNRRQFTKVLCEREYDLIIDLQGLLKSAMVTWLARGKKKIGPSFHREGSRLFYDAVAGKRDKNRHAVEENMDVVRYLGLSCLKPEFPVKFPEKKLAERRPRVAFLPASRWPTKNWPAACFADLGKRLTANRGVSLFLMGGSADAGVCREIEQALEGKAVNMAGKISLVEAGGLLKEMDILISNDSGPVHMAVAVGTPVLAIFGPTDPVRTGPYGGKSRVVAASLSCRPCLSNLCHRGDVACMTAVTVDEVAGAALQMLGMSD